MIFLEEKKVCENIKQNNTSIVIRVYIIQLDEIPCSILYIGHECCCVGPITLTPIAKSKVVVVG